LRKWRPPQGAPLLAFCGVEGVEGYADTRQAREAARLRQIARIEAMTASVDGWEAPRYYPDLSTIGRDLDGKPPKHTLSFQGLQRRQKNLAAPNLSRRWLHRTRYKRRIPPTRPDTRPEHRMPAEQRATRLHGQRRRHNARPQARHRPPAVVLVRVGLWPDRAIPRAASSARSSARACTFSAASATSASSASRSCHNPAQHDAGAADRPQVQFSIRLAGIPSFSPAARAESPRDFRTALSNSLSAVFAMVNTSFLAL